MQGIVLPDLDRLLEQALGPDHDAVEHADSLPDAFDVDADEALEDAGEPAAAEPAPTTEVAEPVPTAVADEVPTAATRYANVECLNQAGAAMRQAGELGASRNFTLRLGIGALKEGSLFTNPAPFPDEMVPEDVYLDVILSSKDFEVAALSGEPFSETAQGSLFLPGKGGPATGPGGMSYLDFRMRIPLAGEASCHISFQFRGAVIQSLLLKKASEVGGGTGAFSVEHLFSLSSQPAELAKVPDRKRLSVLAAARKEGFNQIILYARDGSSVDSDILDIDVAGLTETIRKLRSALEDRAPMQRQRSKWDLKKDLEAIAPFGSELFQRLPGQSIRTLGALQSDPDNTVIHIARSTKAEFVAPWSLIYDIPMTGGALRLCEMVSNWDEKSPLVAPGTRACPHGPHDENVLCPFGFWGMRYSIEQLVSTEKPSTEIVAKESSTIVAAQTLNGVDMAQLNQHLSSMEQIFRRRMPQAVMQIGRDKATIRTLLGQDLPFVYFYCHGERDHDADPNVYLGVGNRESITALDFGNWLWAWYLNQKLKVWDKTRPLVFINACNSLAIYPETLISYVNAFVGRAEAAGVIGTEVKVNQQLAMAFAENFFTRLLSEGSTVDKALRDVRMDYLAAGNLFGLVYTPYCWADLRVVDPAEASA